MESPWRGDLLTEMLLVGFLICPSSILFLNSRVMSPWSRVPTAIAICWQSWLISTTWIFNIFNKLCYMTSKIDTIQSDPDLINLLVCCLCYSLARNKTIKSDVQGVLNEDSHAYKKTKDHVILRIHASNTILQWSIIRKIHAYINIPRTFFSDINHVCFVENRVR